MLRLIVFVATFLVAYNSFVFAQTLDELKQKKQLTAFFTQNPPKIDGELADSAWQNAQWSSNFIQLKPYNDRLAENQTSVCILYDNTALYLAIKLYDTAPDSIATQLTQRDDTGQADFVAFVVDPYNNSLSMFGFFITAAGVQLDIKFSTNGEDDSWDAVWESDVKLTEFGWVAELKIPFSAIRFPKLDEQKPWAINFYREQKRMREESNWNFVDINKDDWMSQSGELIGLKNIQPPLRLAFMPYFSSYVNTNSDTKGVAYSFKGGMDLKYGINESYTLDMMLIPDFGQVQSDDKILNLTPFETFYSEKRSFFTEGMELFSKAGIFHSRRIGGRPKSNNELSDNLLEHEIAIQNPENTQMLNATKITGTSASGLSVGFLNAMTLNTLALIEDTITLSQRKVSVQPFTNYNVLALNKALENNSYISFVNTNLMRFDDDYSANVSGFEAQFKDKKQNYALTTQGALSNIKVQKSEPELGYYYELEYEKITGKYRFELMHRVENHKYNPNDLGYLQNSNEVNYFAELSYNQTKPKNYYLFWNNSFEIGYSTLFYPRVYTNFDFEYRHKIMFKNYVFLGLFASLSPKESHNYFESRVDGKVFKESENIQLSFWLSTNYVNKFAYDFGANYQKNKLGELAYGAFVAPRLRINDKWFTLLNVNLNKTENNLGFVDITQNEDTVFFGSRNLKTLSNTLEFSYTPNNKMGFNFRLRHYWSTVKYNSYSILNDEGYLNLFEQYQENHDISFNAFTIDFVYKWNFAPGSEMSIVWKNAVYNSSEVIIDNYFENTNNLFISSPNNNSLSFKILYYLDYLYLKKS